MWESLPAVKTELELLEQDMRGQFGSKRNINSYLDGLSLGIVESGGKRLRPAMMIAAAMAGEYDREKVFGAAMSVELLHTATLVHDDIIDNSPLRRGVPTLFASRGAKVAVFTGDYIYVKSILSLASSGLPVEYMRQVAKAVEAVCVGEVEQFEGRGKIPGFKTYLSRISRKTGALFAASCAIGAHLGKMPEEDVKRAARFAGYFGIAFQIMDDLLDINKNQAATGKPSGNDLKEGTVTLPVLMAAAKDKELRAMVESYLGAYGKRQMSRKAEEILSRAQRAGAVEDTLAILNRYIAKAKTSLEKLPDSPGKQMLGEITSLTFRDYIREEA